MGRIGKIESIAGYVDQNRTIFTLAKVWIPVAAKTTVYAAILWRTIAAILTGAVRKVPVIAYALTVSLVSELERAVSEAVSIALTQPQSSTSVHGCSTVII